MKLSTKTIEKKEFGDINLIHYATKLSRPTIINAFKGGKITPNVFNLITEYYKPIKK